MNLKHLTDSELIKDLKLLVLEERKCSAKILHHLKEMDRRRLFVEQGYGSLFDYAVHHLGYSSSAAYRRIQAARMLHEIPEIELKLTSGNLNLTHIADATVFFRENKIQDTNYKKEVLKQLESLSKKETAVKLHELSGKKTKRMIHVPLSEDTVHKIEKWQGLHPIKTSSDELVSDALDVAIIVAERNKFKLVGNPHKEKAAEGISAATKREVYLRDHKRCTNCGTTHSLQFDHRTPKALGGSNDKENIRLLCFACNQRAGMRAGLIKN